MERQPPCFTVTTLAAKWNCSKGKVRSLISSGQLNCLHLGTMIRIPPDFVQEYEEKCLNKKPPDSAALPAETTDDFEARVKAARQAVRIERALNKLSSSTKRVL